MDAYVFVRGAGDEVVDALKRRSEMEGSPLRFVTSTSGAYDALVAITADDFAGIERAVKQDVRGSGAEWTETAIIIGPIPPPPPPPMPKWTPPEVFEAFVQIRVDPGTADAVCRGLADLDGAMGSAIVAGDFDVLYEVGGPTWDSLVARLMTMHSVAGVRWTRSAIAYFPDAAKTSS